MSENHEYYRPLQYLGSKTRALDMIIRECKNLYVPDSYVLDLFSGSSIVSQAIFSKKMNVISNDAMQFCSDLTHCLLNISKTARSLEYAEKGINELQNYSLDQKYVNPFKEIIAKETLLLNNNDLEGLKELYNEIPQIGKECGNTEQINYIKEHINHSAYNKVPLVTNYYAGTYFGIGQSLRIDTIRSFIESYYLKNKDKWVYSLFLTALYNSLSLIVHSAGKHFAQPIIINDLDKTKITNQRLFENRSYDVDILFVENINNILSYSNKLEFESKNISLCADILSESFENTLKETNISIVYADPPYTAQQYSRFYHIPEVLHFYKYPQLQIFKGHVTQGIYPENKFKSDFCSKRKAKEAFGNMFNLVSRLGSNLILSYSESKSKETGNERMVTMTDIDQLAQYYLPNYNIKKNHFDFEYKQLNKSDKVVKDKEDIEFLIIFEKL